MKLTGEIVGVMNHYELFNRSLWRVATTVIGEVSFVEALMEALIGASKEIRSKFTVAGRARMTNVLLHSILHLAAYSQTDAPSDMLHDIARRQSRSGRDIAPHLYDIFLTCLLSTVEKYDPEYTGEIGTAWKQVLTRGLEYMKSMYDS